MIKIPFNVLKTFSHSHAVTQQISMFNCTQKAKVQLEETFDMMYPFLQDTIVFIVPSKVHIEMWMDCCQRRERAVLNVWRGSYRERVANASCWLG